MRLLHFDVDRQGFCHLALALSCCREVITVVLDCVPASGLISMCLCMYSNYCAWECPVQYACKLHGGRCSATPGPTIVKL